MPAARRFLGVCFDKRTGRYEATFSHAFLGRYDTPEEAALARDRAALHAGSAVRLNLPKEARERGPTSPEKLRREAVAKLRQKKNLEYYGVRRAVGGSYDAHVTVRRRDVFLGRFERAGDAAVVHDRVQRYLRPKSTWLNFPDMKVSPISSAAHRRELRAAFKGKTTSKYEGVTYEARDLERPWAALVVVRRRNVFLGRWTNERNAALAHDRGALRYIRGKARLNFPAEAKKLKPADAETLIAEARHEKKRRTTSKFLGVCFHRAAGKWSATVSHHDRTRYLGIFDDEDEAALARDKEVIRLRGDHSRVNFHPETGEPVGGRRLRDLIPGGPSSEASRRGPPPSSDRSSPATTNRGRIQRRARQG